ncbi:hypothetical protein PACTADRAFT_44939 [Pachysolen tannophilus NRRL Y-2460]|uniref:D-isomer specific 2-hydroxyacid dehydrogenase NAD-binding domain-containing protein n=1 Tax=Pachysolen tannophilus NRRL Y-2460 TaxID=669874 RepID=A0A1E4TR39_PACTA|nr:hypothetical protein PACTADRAFT_44939 [Pachysolen tannophilus NRRL Y-2460]
MSITKPKVLFLGDLNEDLIEYKEFKQKFDCIFTTLTTREQLVKDFQTKYSNIQAIYGSWLGFHLIGGFNKELIENAPLNLKIITVCSVGYDGYDIESMTNKGIILTNTPSIGADHVADTVLYFTLSSFRFFQNFQNELKFTKNTIKSRIKLQQNNHLNENNYAFGHIINKNFKINSPKDKNVIIVGFGNIGIKIAKRLFSIGMKINYVKRNKLSKLQELNLGFPVNFFPNLKEAAPIADLIILALPGSPETRHMLNKNIIDLLPTNSRIINVGRGSIINEKDLIEALENGKISFAGLDVFENEPQVPQALLNKENVICTPHIAGSTVENFDESAIYCLKNIENVLLQGKNPSSKVN